MRRLLLCVAWLLAAVAAPLWAQDVQPVPAPTARVLDNTGTLSESQRAALEAKLAAFEAQAGPQIVVLIVNNTAPEDISSYAQRVADSWKIGRRNVGDGVLVLVAKGDRQVRVEVAKALEGAIPDLAARQIIDNAIRPAFRANDYAGGLNAALDQLMGRIRGEHLPPPAARGGGSDAGSLFGGMPIEGIAIFFFVAVSMVGGLLSRIVGRKFGALLTAGAAGGLAWLISTSVLIALAAGVVALVLVGIFGGASALRTASMGRGGFGGGYGGGFGGGFGGFGGVYPHLEISLKLRQIECPRIDFHRDFGMIGNPKFSRQSL